MQPLKRSPKLLSWITSRSSSLLIKVLSLFKGHFWSIYFLCLRFLPNRALCTANCCLYSVVFLAPPSALVFLAVWDISRPVHPEMALSVLNWPDQTRPNWAIWTKEATVDYFSRRLADSGPFWLLLAKSGNYKQLLLSFGHFTIF